jgi:glucose/arabinose dehydrogenase
MNTRKVRLYRPCLESLEDRTVPSVSISIAGSSINEIGNSSSFITAGSGGLSQPTGVTLGSDGNVYVSSRATNQVLRYNGSTGAFIDAFVTQGSGGLSGPWGQTFGPDGNLYVASESTNQVLRYNGSTGAFIDAFISAGSGGLDTPRGVRFGSDGSLYVTSRSTSSILRYQGPLASSPGAPLPAPGQSGATFVAPSSGGLIWPLYLLFGSDGKLYVASEQNAGILRYDGTTGAFIDTFVPGGRGNLASGRSMVFDPDGRLYVADSGHGVHRYDAQGNFVGDLLVNSVSPSLNAPVGMAFDAVGNLLLSSRINNIVVRYDRGVNVTLSAASATPVSVNYTTVDGSALAGTDYYAQSGTVTFNPGQTSREILLATQETASLDGNDSFSVQLSNPTGGATIATSSATVTIVDPTRQFSIADTSAIEGDHTAHYRGAFAQGIPGNSFRSVTFGPDGNLYVSTGTGPAEGGVDRYNGTTGTFIDHFVTDGQTPGTRDPLFRAGYLYVGSDYSNQVKRFDATTGAFVDVFVTPGSGGLNGIAAMEFGPDANGDGVSELYVSSGNSVLRYDGVTGQPVGTYITPGSGGLSSASGLTFDSTNTYVYVASSGSNQVLKYNAQTGAFVGVAASAGVVQPNNVQFGPDGLMYVLSSGNNRILRFNSSGTYIDDYVPAGSGGMVFPLRLAFGSDGDLYVSALGTSQSPVSQILRFGTENEALFTVTNTTASTLPLTVTYATSDGTAIAGRDYTATSGTFTFAPGVTTDTIRVPLLDDGVVQSGLSFNLTLSNPVAATLSRATAAGTITDTDGPSKFYVVNDATSSLGGTNTTYKYLANGTQQAPVGLNLADLDPRGVASNAAGTKQWVVDANQNVYVYNPSGTLLGSWSAGGLSSSATLTGIATNGSDIWLVDSYTAKVYDYTGAASRLSGSQSAASSFSLASSRKNNNINPQDIVTDGTSFWVVDGSALKVFKYTLSGSLLGSWSIDPADTHPTGITINPNNVSDIWIVDNGTDKVYQYTAAASRTSGSQSAAASFALAANNTNPQGIADPPVPGQLIPPALAPLATTLPVSPILNASARSRESAVAGILSVTGRDAMWARLGEEILRTANEPIPSFTSGNRTLVPSGLSGERHPSDRQTFLAPVGVDGSGSEPSTAELLEDAFAADVSQASTAAMDSFFAMLADRPIS